MWRRFEQRRASHHNHDYSTDYGTDNYCDSRYYFGSDYYRRTDYYRDSYYYRRTDNYRRSNDHNDCF